MNQRVAIYTRVSSEEQIEGYSLAAQQEIASKFADSKGWQVVRVYEERGRSGKTTIRPEFQAMMHDARLRHFDVILVHKLDRFSRSLLDVLLSIKSLNQYGIVLVSASEPMMDFSTPQGRLMAVLVAAIAEWYLENLREEIKKGKQERARQGDWNGTLSYGYTTPKRLTGELEQLGQQYRTGNLPQDEYERLSQVLEDALEASGSKHETAAIPHPIHRHAVALAFSTYAQGGASFMDIADLLNLRGYRIAQRGGGVHPFNRDTIDDLLKNPFYTGAVQYKGDWGRGAHEPLISHELFDECQRARARRAQKHHVSPPNSKRVYPLGGILHCLECGNQWYGNVLRGTPVYRDTPRQRLQQCGAPIKSVDAEAVEKLIGDYLCSIEFSDDLQARLRAAANTPTGDDATERQKAKVQRQLENLTTLFKLDDISHEEYLKQRAILRAQLASMSRVGDVTVAELQQVAEVITNLRPVWKKATLQEKKLILQRLIKVAYVRHGVIVAVEPMPVLWHLIRSAGRIGSHSNLCLPSKPLNSSIVCHFLNAKHSRHS